MDTRTVLVELGKRISNRRKEMRMTQEYLADKMDVSPQTISYIETGKKGIRPENLIKLCSVLEVSADYILTGAVSSPVYDEMNERISKLTSEQAMYFKKIIDSCLNLIELNNSK